MQFPSGRLIQQAAVTPTPEAGFSPITSNDDWVPVEQVFDDGISMVLVPVGCFEMGREGGTRDDIPVHQQCFDEPFWLDMTEVTQSDFVRLGGNAAHSPVDKGDLLPVSNIDWFEARDFCNLRGGRLPAEHEWEYAARGPDNWINPWGNDWNDNYAVWLHEGVSAEVGSRPEGRSWVGAVDLGGNVWEWVNSRHDPYPYVPDDGREAEIDRTSDDFRVIRGGSYLIEYSELLSLPYRGRMKPDAFDVDNGFRCARDYE
ncbi:MAG: formylglycine-generating enzyme family protein [Anaerolineae bacterium]|nr:formylglycine-generating enzyme family protein [Anaerolineae bacterium]